MTTDISNYISQIRAKAQSLHHELVEERMRASNLANEVSRLNSELAHFQEASERMQQENAQLKSELAEKREQVQVSSEAAVPHMRTEEIDVLVKEIDFCIQQLKIANG
jgi:predicted  nucleic acid-binding Zn-ribbon protein